MLVIITNNLNDTSSSFRELGGCVRACSLWSLAANQPKREKKTHTRKNREASRVHSIMQLPRYLFTLVSMLNRHSTVHSPYSPITYNAGLQCRHMDCHVFWRRNRPPSPHSLTHQKIYYFTLRFQYKSIGFDWPTLQLASKRVSDWTEGFLESLKVRLKHKLKIWTRPRVFFPPSHPIPSYPSIVSHNPIVPWTSNESESESGWVFWQVLAAL